MNRLLRAVKKFVTVPENWRLLAFGICLGAVLPVAIALVWGPKVTTTYEDPLTGRWKNETVFLGSIVSSEIKENHVSRWAYGNSIPVIRTGNFGWSAVTTEGRDWFTGTWVACGGSGIPHQIHKGKIKIEGLTAEQTIQLYQRECVDAYREHESMSGVMRRWWAMLQTEENQLNDE